MNQRANGQSGRGRIPAGLSRRLLLSGIGASIASAATAQDYNYGNWYDRAPARPEPGTSPARAVETKRLAVPDFSSADSAPIRVAGLRPHRDGGMRLALGRPVDADGRRIAVVHNYGHGGGGLSLAFGAADTTRNLVAAAIKDDPHPRIAVLGAGVVGLTSALTLRERWPQATITLYARQIDAEQTTSYWAGGQFAVSSSLAEYTTAAERRLLLQHLDLSERRFAALAAKGQAERYGISRRTAYSLTGQGVRLILGENTTSASSYGSWLIDPTRLLPALKADLTASGVRFVPRGFSTREDLADLDEDVIVNCTGVGAGDLFEDRNMRPCRGHLVILRNDVKADYFLNSWCGQGRVSHIFARTNDIIIGGSQQWEPTADQFNPDDPSDLRITDRILRNARALFQQRGHGRCA